MNTNNPRPFAWDLNPSIKRIAIETLIREINAKHAIKRADNWQKLRPFSGFELNGIVWAIIAATAVAVTEISGWLPQMLPTALGGGPL